MLRFVCSIDSGSGMVVVKDGANKTASVPTRYPLGTAEGSNYGVVRHVEEGTLSGTYSGFRLETRCERERYREIILRRATCNRVYPWRCSTPVLSLSSSLLCLYATPQQRSKTMLDCSGSFPCPYTTSPLPTASCTVCLAGPRYRL